MRYFLFPFAVLWLVFMAVAACLIQSGYWLQVAADKLKQWATGWASRWYVALWLIFWGYAAQAQQPTLLSPPPPNGTNALEYTGSVDTLWGFAILIVEYQPQVMRLDKAFPEGETEYALQPVPAYCVGWRPTMSAAQFFRRDTGQKIDPARVVWFKLIMPKE